MIPVRLLKTCLTLVAIGAATAQSGCRPAIDAFGETTVSAGTYAGEFATAMEQRFTRVTRTPKVSYARARMAQYALAPSKLVNDTALWTALRSTVNGSERDLEIFGGMSGSLSDGNFAFVSRARAAPLSKLGDARHYIGLTQVSTDNEWRWTTSVENDIGTMPPARASNIIRALFASAEYAPSAVRAAYRLTSPRTTSALGRLVTMDSLSSVKQNDGSALVTLQMVLSDAKLKTEFPEFAKYVRKYLEPMKMHLRLHDTGGAQWFDVRLEHLRIVMRFRSHNGELQPIFGADRPMPDKLLLTIDGTTKLSFFTVGVSNLHGEFVHSGKPSDNAWVMRFAEEPEWHLPLIGEKLLQSPLKRPFADQGIQFRIGVASNTAGQTILYRNMTAVVQESAIMRFLGNLGSTAVSDFAGKVEKEQNRFIAEWFRAMHDDVTALAPFVPQ